MLYTRLSHRRGQIGDPNLWRNVILKDQLQVTEEQFWACVDGGVTPPRPAPKKPVERAGLPAKLAVNLLRKLSLTPDQLAAMTKDEAVQAWNDSMVRSPAPTAGSPKPGAGHHRDALRCPCLVSPRAGTVPSRWAATPSASPS